MVGVGGILVALGGMLVAVGVTTTGLEHPESTTVVVTIRLTSSELRNDMHTPMISLNCKLTSWVKG
jgi:hypothetical protein